MKKTLLLITAVITLPGCSDANKATTTLSQNGYTDIRIDGHAWFMCDDKDKFSTKFYATSPNGTKVSGAVCSGFFKGNTIRFD